MNAPTTKYLKDYRAPDFRVNSIDLTFDLYDDHCLVTSEMECEKTSQDAAAFVCDGVELELVSICLDGVALNPDQYKLTDEQLIVPDVPEHFRFKSIAKIYPQKNTSLEGLYRSGKMFCTQCEAEGFRKITWYPDRPDVMSSFSTTIIADRKKYPVLLSNGNPVDEGTIPEKGRHWVKWVDPFKKPSYLFALVAGDLRLIQDQFTTASGRVVDLRIYVEEENISKCDHAMESLKRSMAWDEENYGREYDLDIYMIVAVNDFNMGAMENKGLNIFNSACVLARPDTATDGAFERIEAVIAHEYFHNWTGNRITCRDWFQLSLKEGLTVFRDQQYTADMTSQTVKRIKDVNVLRTHQFAEDAGPNAHAVRPDSYIEINNFYTITIYEKGAEVIRMIHSILGENKFRKGMDRYFERYDGQAVTTEDFVKVMEEAGEADLGQFRRWYTQAGTPTVIAKSEYDEQNQTFSLTLRQETKPTPGQGEKLPLHIPVATGLLGIDGEAMVLDVEGDVVLMDPTHAVLNLRDETETFFFKNVTSKPVPSLFRDFSAPVKLKYGYSDGELLFLMANDNDSFNRWEAAQQLALKTLLRLIENIQAKRTLRVHEGMIEAFRTILLDQSLDPSFVATVLQLPSEAYLAEQMDVVDVDAIHQSREFLKLEIAKALKSDFLEVCDCYRGAGEYRFTPEESGKRTLKNLLLNYLAKIDSSEMTEFCRSHYLQSNNMTDELGGLLALLGSGYSQRDEDIQRFYSKWKDDSLVMDLWFSVQAQSEKTTLKTVQSLLEHESFDYGNPNKLRALIGGFCSMNPIGFHQKDGSGYVFLADQIIRLNDQNPQVAARLVIPLTRWRRFDQSRQKLMSEQLRRILDISNLSKDLFEIVSKSLS